MEATIFKNTAKIEKLTAEVLVTLASFLNVSSILQLSLTCKTFRHLIKDDLLFRRLTERDYRVTTKPSTEQNWLQYYKDLKHHKETAKDTPEATIASTVDSENGEQQQQQEAIEKPVDKQSGMNKIQTPALATTSESANKEEIDSQPVNDSTKVDTVSVTKEGACPHLGDPSDLTIEVKKVIYGNSKNDANDDKPLCDLCHSEPAAYLNMHHDNYIEACLSCLSKEDAAENDDNRYPVQIELETGDLYCFKCGDVGHPRKLTEEKDGEKVKTITEYINASESEDDLDKRRKAEHQLYVQELRREDMSLKFYLVEKQWGRTWMLFRTREGSPLPTKITNQKLARANGTLDPNIRLPMDKYRPSPETHGDIVSEKLWGYLSKAYGVQGRAYSEDDIIAPEYARLRVYVDDFKKSIYLYP